MKITMQTDYALRVLIQVALHDGALVRISDVAQRFDISRNHLTKVVHRLGARGYLETLQGRGGGMRLARAPAAITVGEVVRDFEAGIPLVECFDPRTSRCRIDGACTLKRALSRAQEAFLQSLDSVTLADLLTPRDGLLQLLAPVAPTRSTSSGAARTSR